MITIKHFPQPDKRIGWYELSPYRNAIKSSEACGELAFDVAIVGAGFTGVAAARRLSEIDPTLNIALIDALKIGEGPSGRNSGHLVDAPGIPTLSNFNFEKYRKTFEMQREALATLRDLVEEHCIDAQWDESGKFLVARETKNYAGLGYFTHVMDKLGQTYQHCNQQELTRALGTEFYTRGVFWKGNVMANPASLIMGLARALPNNVSIFENSPVREMKVGKVKELKFDRGTITCEKLLLAANGHNDQMRLSKSCLAPMVTYASLTRPLQGKELDSFKDAQAYGARASHPAGTSLRYTPDHRIMIRNTFRAALNDTEQCLSHAVKKHRESFINRYPDIKDVPFEYSWGGNICITLNGEAQFSEIDEDVFSVAGMNGAGIVKGTSLGGYMAEYMCKQKSPELDFVLANSNPTWVPPNPFRYLGASARLKYEEFSAGSEV